MKIEVPTTPDLVAESDRLTIEVAAEALGNLPGPGFWTEMPGRGLVEAATRWAYPFFALRQFLPEEWSSNMPVNVVLGGHVRALTDFGGRGVTALRRALRVAPSISLTIWCEGALPSERNVRREILLLPPAKIVRKPWEKALAKGQGRPDVLLLVTSLNPGDERRFVERLGRAPADVPTLVGAPSTMHALLVRALLTQSGYTVGELHEFGSSTNEPQAFTGHVWFRVELDPANLRPLSPEDLEHWETVCSGIEEAHLTTVFRDAGHARWYGKCSNLFSDGEMIPCLFTGPADGISLRTGQYFVMNPSREPGAPTILLEDEYPVSEEVLEEARAIAAITETSGGLRLDEVRRYHALRWLADLAVEEEAVPQVEETGAGSPAAVEAVAVPPAPPDVSEPVPAPVPVRAVRPARLDRAAGTTEVLALAAVLGGEGRPVSLTQASALVLDWLSSKGFKGLAPNASDQVSTPDGEVTVETDGAKVWAVRFDDRRHMADGAIWRVEMTLLALHETCALGVRLSQLRSSAAAPDPASGVPGAVVSLSRAFGLWDGGTKLVPEVTVIRSPGLFDWLRATLLDPGRALSVVVVSCRSGETDPSLARLATRLLGLAHVVVIGPGVARQLSEVLPPRYAVYGDAIRVFRPRPGHEDNPRDHPLWTSYSGNTLSPGMANQIAEAVSAISLEHENLDERAPSFRSVRQELTESRLAALQQRTNQLASTAEEERARHEAIVHQLEKSRSDQAAQIEELRATVDGLNEEIKAIRIERDAALDEVRAVRHQLSLAWGDRSAPPVASWNSEDAADAVDAGGPAIPEDWDGLEDWIERHCGGRLVLLPSAAKACRESRFRDVPLAYRSLLLLANEYVAMRRRGPDEDDRKAAFEDARQALGLDCSPVGSAKDSHQFKAGYHKMFEGRQIQLDMHLKRRNGFDEHTLLRVYFAYCEDTQRVIVGHMPTHLVNRKTRNA